jgi:phospholipid/cholesterol/gamma-HCH transport system permease protein
VCAEFATGSRVFQDIHLTVSMATLDIADGANNAMVLRFAGSLDAYSVAGLWQRAKTALRGAAERPVILDAQAVEYCDGAGVALFAELLRQPRNGAAQTLLLGLRAQYQGLLAQFKLEDLKPVAPEAAPPFGIEQFGRLIALSAAGKRDEIAFVGEACAALARTLGARARLRWRDTLAVAEQAGANALPIVTVIAFLLGIILAFQSAVPMQRFGAEIFVADLVALSLLRELGPLVTAILFAGRSGAAFAAEIGAMKVNDEVNALTTMGLDPVEFLVVPRLLAALLVAPLLTVYADLVGLVGGALTMLAFDIPWVAYWREVSNAVGLMDFANGILKSIVFGLLVAGVGCLRGLQTQPGASGVGQSTTRAVVSGIVLIIAVDGIFAVVYYCVGI